MSDRDLTAYLGDAADQVTDEQRQRLLAAAADIDARYPDPDDSDERGAAFSAAVQWVLGDITTEQAGEALFRARVAEAAARAAARQVGIMAVEDDATELQTARDLGVDRMALRGWLGKR